MYNIKKIEDIKAHWDSLPEDQRPSSCACGRSPTGYCMGYHSMTNEQYQKYLEAQQNSLNEQVKPQFLVD
jgi:hypothetical protein